MKSYKHHQYWDEYYIFGTIPCWLNWNVDDCGEDGVSYDWELQYKEDLIYHCDIPDNIKAEIEEYIKEAMKE